LVNHLQTVMIYSIKYLHSAGKRRHCVEFPKKREKNLTPYPPSILQFISVGFFTHDQADRRAAEAEYLSEAVFNVSEI
jgi:hypothetical protein